MHSANKKSVALSVSTLLLVTLVATSASASDCTDFSSLQMEWRMLDTSATPPNGAVPLAWDSSRGVAVAWTSNCGPSPRAGTWEFDDDWDMVAGVGEPPTCDKGYLAFDACRNLIVQYGGAGSGDSPYEYDGTSWTVGSRGPCNRDRHRIVGVPNRCTVFMFGGRVFCGGGLVTDVAYEYDGTSWTPHFPPTRPPARWNHAMAYDSLRNVAIVFGGFSGSVRLGDTWEFSFDTLTWSEVSTPSAPSPRDWATMAYDPQLGATILFGGSDGTFRNDTWMFDGCNWTEMTLATSPPASPAFLTYDSESKRLLLLQSAQTWEFLCPEANAEIGPDRLNFGRVLMGHPTSTRRLAIRNRGCSSIEIKSISALSAPFTLTESLDLPFLLAPGDSTTIGLGFHPTAADYFRDIIEVATDSLEFPVLSAEVGGRGIDPESPLEYVFEDFNDFVTKNDTGFNDFQGNSGAIDSTGGDLVVLAIVPDSQDAPGHALRLNIDFSMTADTEAFAGWFNSMFGLTSTRATFDGETVVDLPFPQYTIDMTDLFAEHLGEPDLDIEQIRLFLKNEADQAVIIKFELKNSNGPAVFARRTLEANETMWSEVVLLVPDDFSSNPNFDYTRVKEFNLIVERNNNSANVHNPDHVAFLIDNIRFVDIDDHWIDADALSDDDVLDLIERRAFQYFLDWSGRRRAGPRNVR